MDLKPDSLLKNGEYRICKTLGNGGFGITYLAEQVSLERMVAIKEFFMKEYCNRDAETSQMSVGSNGSIELVERFRQKFIKEARSIAKIKHRHIISVIDVFEDNGTAYYVMEYVGGDSLSDKVKNGALPEHMAVRYIRQVASALDFVHSKRMMHLDVKPANVLLSSDDDAVLIDFGLAKQYDESGAQTSSTPVGISHGYAPLEQYKRGGVGTFSPAADIYSLGATLYKLLTGITPPEAGDVNDDGLPALPQHISAHVRAAVEAAMQPRRKDRPQSIAEFLKLLENRAKSKAASFDNTSSDRSCAVQTPFAPHGSRPASVVKAESFDNIGSDSSSTPGGESELSTVKTENAKNYTASPDSEETVAGVITDNEETCIAGNKNKVFTINGVDFTMVAVEGGTFEMGGKRHWYEFLRDDIKHTVTLDNYYIGETEVTQALWQAVMGSNPSRFTGDLQRPVERVSYNDCKEFINKLNSLLANQLPNGRKFRFPTEAQWEYAARGGNRSRGYQYSGSNNIGDVAWCYGNSGNTTHPVKQKQANELGLYDMSGNVWEWCYDLYGGYSSTPQANPEGPSRGSFRVLRGGCWRTGERDCRVANRDGGFPGNRHRHLGLRLAL